MTPVECNIGEVKSQGGQPGTSTSRLAGIGDSGTYAGVAQEPGRSRRFGCEPERACEGNEACAERREVGVPRYEQ